MIHLAILFAMFTSSFQGEVTGHNGVIITGNIKNYNEEFIILSHIPRLRGNLNYDGFASIGSPIHENGSFYLESRSIIDGALYFLEIGDKGFFLDLLAGDSIHLEFDLDDIDRSLFATGRGAGKINLLRLKDFQHTQFSEYENIERFRSEMDKSLENQLAILHAVHNGDVNNTIVAGSNERIKIEKIIRQTPVSRGEFEFLNSQILARKFALASFLKVNAQATGLDSSANISPYLSEVFMEENYSVINNLNHPHVANRLDDILEVEFARHNLSINGQITLHDFSVIRRNPLYYKWAPGYIQENFSSDVFDKWFADDISMLMTLGGPYNEKFEKFKQQCSNTKYLDRLIGFHHLLSKGLSNPEYRLNDPELTLDKMKFEALLKSYQGQAVYIVFWSAQYAGASIINHLPLIQTLEKTYKDQFKVIHICIDRTVHKNLWAARIIDNSWTGEHYFMPIEENEKTLVDFGSDRISSFCYGGATYSFVSGNGTIHKDIDPPMKLKQHIIRKMLN